jgi:2,3-bisphosphoglycerate-independent phosphoglycerate mutase
MIKPKPLMLIILDGWGIDSHNKGNAVQTALTPNLDRLLDLYPSCRLECSGEAVGLPKGIMGNSEVGHLNIGAGRVVYQDLLRIDNAIADGSFHRNTVLQAAISKVLKLGSTLHLIGLVSDGGVHSQLTHLMALIDMARQSGLNNVAIHAILDGRDTPPDSGVRYLTQLQQYIAERGTGKIATVCGRFYAMDRDNRWSRIEKAYRLYVHGEGHKSHDPVEAVNSSYLKNKTDEFLEPTIIIDPDGVPVNLVSDDDGVIFFNFRADRAREITRAFTMDGFDEFQRDIIPKLCDYVCMTFYDEKFTLPVAFPPIHLKEILGEIISREGLRQLRIAETEKYAHVTYFFNGGKEKPFPQEERCLIPSPREIDTYDLKPEMSAELVTNEVLERLESDQYDVIIMNFANMDMVGHTGILPAAIKACETVDQCIGRIIKQIKSMGGIALITADHGNSEKMLDDKGHVHTAHTLNPVPFVLVDDSRRNVVLRNGILADITPTILELMAIEKPKVMTGASLIAA